VFVAVPEKPGRYQLAFSLVYNNEICFGDLVSLNLLAKFNDEFNVNKSEVEEQRVTQDLEQIGEFNETDKEDDELSTASWCLVDEFDAFETQGETLDLQTWYDEDADLASLTERRGTDKKITQHQISIYTSKLKHEAFDLCYMDNLVALMKLGFGDFD